MPNNVAPWRKSDYDEEWEVSRDPGWNVARWFDLPAPFLFCIIKLLYAWHHDLPFKLTSILHFGT